MVVCTARQDPASDGGRPDHDGSGRGRRAEGGGGGMGDMGL